MNPYEQIYGTDSFWAGVESRLSPLLGDLNVTLGRNWADLFSRYFGRLDFQCVDVARRTHGVTPEWHVVEWHQAAWGISLDDDWVVAGRSRQECVAHLVGRCADQGVWPDSVSFDEVSAKTVVTLKGKPFAVVRPVARANELGSAQRSRVEGTLLGLQRSIDSRFEFQRRLAHWPGLGSIQIGALDVPDGVGPHWPCPSEWIISARKLLEAAGVKHPTMAQAQQFAAAVMGSESWNHLSGLLPSGSPRTSWMALLAPYYVYGEDPSDHSDLAVYQDAAEAFLDLRARAANACAKLGAARVYLRECLRGYPWVEFEQVPPDGASFDEILFLPGLATMSPVNPVEYSDAWLERVRFAMRDSYIGGLRRLLMLDADEAERMEVHASEMGLEILATDGLWRFYVEDLEHCRGILLAELFDVEGSKIGVASVPQYKGEIHALEGAPGFVLTSDYSGKHPVAILRGLSAGTLAKLRDALPSTEFSYGMELNEGDQRTLSSLMQKVTEGGAVR